MAKEHAVSQEELIEGHRLSADINARFGAISASINDLETFDKAVKLGLVQPALVAEVREQIIFLSHHNFAQLNGQIERLRKLQEKHDAKCSEAFPIPVAQ